MSLIEKLKKNCGVKEAAVLSKSDFFQETQEEEHFPTPVPAINIAISGSMKRGMIPGILLIAGESKRFKSLFALLMAAAYLKKYPDAALLFFDSEFGISMDYMRSIGIDTDRVLHVPVKTIEELKVEMTKQLDALEADDKVAIMVDSLGNLASKKELEDALSGKDVTDMTRAKAAKSLFRIITPYVKMKRIPAIFVMHTYKTQEMYAKDVVSGGTGGYYSANDIWIIGRRQQKDGKELTGFEFIINIEKSRQVIEGSKIPIEVSFDHGINRFSGLLEIAEHLGFVVKPSQGWYSRVINGEQEEKKWRKKDTNTKEFWKPLLTDEKFDEAIQNLYRLSKDKRLLAEDEIDEEKEEMTDE